MVHVKITLSLKTQIMRKMYENIFPLEDGNDNFGLISTAFKSSTTFATNISLFYLHHFP